MKNEILFGSVRFCSDLFSSDRLCWALTSNDSEIPKQDKNLKVENICTKFLYLLMFAPKMLFRFFTQLSIIYELSLYCL